MEFIAANAKGAKCRLRSSQRRNPHGDTRRCGGFCDVRIIRERMGAIDTKSLFGGFLVGTEWPNPEFDGLTIPCKVGVHVGDGHG